MLRRLKTKGNSSNGLTIVELLVVVSIFIIITGISIFNYSKFESYTSTQNLADDIALTIRQAQSYATGVRGIAEIDYFNVGYGVHFALHPHQNYYYSGSPSTFILFADINNNRIYDYDENESSCGSPREGNECLEMFTIKSDDFITSFYLDKTLEISSTDDAINIMFKRPSPEPILCRISVGECETDISSIGIVVSNQKDDELITKIIEVSNVGQISVF